MKSYIPEFYKPIEFDLNRIIGLCATFFPYTTLIPSDKPIWLYNIPTNIDSSIKDIMLSPTSPLFPNQAPNTYQRRLMISNDSGDPIYMKIGTEPYNTQIIVTTVDTIMPIQNSPLQTITGRKTISLRSDFTPSNPPTINDIPFVNAIETPFTSRKEVMSAVINGSGYSNRNNLQILYKINIS